MVAQENTSTSMQELLNSTMPQVDQERIAQALDHVEHLLVNETFTDHYIETSVNAMCQHVIRAGGKRMRPRLCLIAAHALPNYDTNRDLKDVAFAAAAMELIHTATLVHDDVIDKATTRRGVTTLNDTSGNHAAVLAGDYLFTRGFDFIHRPRNFDVMEALNYTLRQLVVGELFQLEHEGDIKLTKETYFNTIYAKTGVLFEMATSSPTLLVPGNKELKENMMTYGRKLGIAFQIKDDMLDFSANAQELGKDPGSDLKDGRITLPILLALENTPQVEQEPLIAAINNADIDKVQKAILNTKALDYCAQTAEQVAKEAVAALDKLAPSPYKDELIRLCYKSINRNT